MNKEELYNLVFNDGLGYTDFYFNKRRNKVKSYEKTANNNTIGLVNIVDINIQCVQRKYKTALITGLCTSPDMRKIGVMQSLLSEVLEKLKEDKYQLAVLSPKDDNYYKKYGFNPLIKVKKEVVKYIANPCYNTKNASKIDTKLLLDLYNKTISKYDNYQIIDNNIILDLIDEYNIDNNNIQIVYDNNLPIGWFIAENDRVEIAILPNSSILNHIKEIDNFYYLKQDLDGEKELFQIKYLDKNIDEVKLNTTFVLNKY